MREARLTAQRFNLPLARTSKSRRGFTILELLVVISIMAMLATLATGAVLKAVRQSRNKRVDTTITALEMALVNYRARENKWPVDINLSGQNTTVWFHGIDNSKVFKALYDGGSDGTTKYLDGSALLVGGKEGRMTLREALNLHIKDMAIGYPLPANPNIFCCYCVEFNPLTDSVKVHRHDMRQTPYKPENRVEGDHTCPDGYWGKVN